MNNRQLEQVGTPDVIFRRPATPFIAQFVSTADFLVGKAQDKAIVTEVGRLPLREELPGGTSVKIMIKPDFIGIRPAEDGVGVIADRVFRDIAYLYRIELPSGATICSLQHHNRSYSIDTRVLIQINPNRRMVYFVARTESQSSDQSVKK